MKFGFAQKPQSIQYIKVALVLVTGLLSIGLLAKTQAVRLVEAAPTADQAAAKAQVFFKDY